MSIKKLLADLEFWKENENVVEQWFKENGYQIVPSGSDTSIFDFHIELSWRKVNLELKTRRCAKDQYEDTLIGANKLWEAWHKFYANGEETLFLFSYTDGLYYLNPLEAIPRRSYTLQRWDRGGIDKPKGWVYYNTKDLKKIY